MDQTELLPGSAKDFIRSGAYAPQGFVTRITVERIAGVGPRAAR